MARVLEEMSLTELVGELIRRCEEHDRLLARPRSSDGPVRGRPLPDGSTRRLIEPCGDNPQVEEADIRNRLSDPMEEVEENHTSDRIDVEPRAPSPPSTIQGGGGIGGS